MRNRGHGSIVIGGIPEDATVVEAFLYWVVLNPGTPPATGMFDGHSIEGAFIGSGIDPCWDGLAAGGTAVDARAAWTFRADVTGLVSSPGNGVYELSGFPSGETDGRDPFLTPPPNRLPLLEGASLVVVYSSPVLPPRDIVIYDGNGSVPDALGNSTLTLDLSGFRASPTAAPSARIAFIGADGQAVAEDGDRFNETLLTEHGGSPWDGSDGCCGYRFGDLWDTDIFDVGPLVSPGDATATAAVSVAEDCLVWTAAVLSVAAEDIFPPVCGSSTSGSGAQAVVSGSAADERPGDSGIASVTLDPASMGLVLAVGPGFVSGEPSVEFTLRLDGTASSGSGSAIVSDLSGKTCRVGASYTKVAEGPLHEQPLFADGAQGVTLFVREGNATTTDVAVVDTSPPGPDEAACLPACFEFPPAALALTVGSPIEGDASVRYDLQIPSDTNLRLLFRHADDADPCPYEDITTSVQDVASGLRLEGGARWSRVQFVAGRLVPGCVPATDQDVDGDGSFSGPGIDPEDADCDDANRRINPRADEICNGMDDDCDGAADEGKPGGGAACVVPGRIGACAEGIQACAGGVLSCVPITEASPEVCDGRDNDCDTFVDEGFPFCGVAKKADDYRRLCRGRHKDDALTQADADCANDAAAFADVTTVAAVCSVLEKDPPREKCDKAEAEFMGLLLNLCRPRLYDALAIVTRCSAATTVGEAVAEIDALLSNPGRTHDDCRRAECLAKAINSGRAQALD